MIKQLNPNATTFPSTCFENVNCIYRPRQGQHTEPCFHHTSMRSNRHSPHQTCYNWTQMNAQLVSCVQKKRLMNYLATLIQPRQTAMMLMLIVVISVWTRNLTTYCIHALRSIREQKCEVKLVVHVHAVIVKSDCI